MGRKKKVPEIPSKLSLCAPGDGLQINSYGQCREVLVQALNAMILGKLSAGEAKSVSYLVQTILSCLHREYEIDDAGQDSVKELVRIIQEERAMKTKDVETVTQG